MQAFDNHRGHVAMMLFDTLGYLLHVTIPHDVACAWIHIRLSLVIQTVH